MDCPKLLACNFRPKLPARTINDSAQVAFQLIPDCVGLHGGAKFKLFLDSKLGFHIIYTCSFIVQCGEKLCMRFPLCCGLTLMVAALVKNELCMYM